MLDIVTIAPGRATVEDRASITWKIRGEEAA
jgi:hypothetical protein